MFIYIDLSYYRDAFKGKYAGMEDIEMYIDEANFTVAAAVNFTDKANLAITPKMLLEQATARQVDYLVENPQVISGSNVSSVSLGSFSISGGADSGMSATLGKGVQDILLYAGLLNRGVCVV